jgi:hypothetical protein
MRHVVSFIIVAAVSAGIGRCAGAEPDRAALLHQCSALWKPDIQRILKSALGDLLSTYQRGVRTSDLLRSFRNRAKARASQLDLSLDTEIAELSPFQLENCIPGARPVFEYLAGDLDGDGLNERLMKLYCAEDQSRCTGSSGARSKSR